VSLAVPVYCAGLNVSISSTFQVLHWILIQLKKHFKLVVFLGDQNGDIMPSSEM
jgi:hypothetical protein